MKNYPHPIIVREGWPFLGGLIARRILCYVRAGEALTRGQRYGFIRFGSRVDVFCLWMPA